MMERKRFFFTFLLWLSCLHFAAYTQDSSCALIFDFEGVDCNITRAVGSRYAVEIDIVIILNGTVIGGVNTTFARGAALNGSLSETFPYINSSASVGNTIIRVSEGLAMRFPFQNTTITVSNTTLEMDTPESPQYLYTIASSIMLSNRTAEVDVVVEICGQTRTVCNTQPNVTCPPEVTCNLTASRNPDGRVNVHVSGDNTTLLNDTISNSVLWNETAVLQSSSIMFAFRQVNGSIVLIATAYTCPFCSAVLSIANLTEVGSGANNSGNVCPQTVLCNVTAIRNASGTVAIQVIAAAGVLLDTSLQYSALSSNGTTISVNSSLQLTLMIANDSIILSATENLCLYCTAQALIASGTQNNSSNESTCPQTKVCNVTAVRNASGTVAIKVIAAAGVLSDTSLEYSTLSSNGTTISVVNSSLQLTLMIANDSIILSATENLCLYCTAQALIASGTQNNSSNESTCPQTKVCNVTAVRNASGTVAIQVTTADGILLDISLQDSVLMSNNGTTLPVNSSLDVLQLTVTLMRENSTVIVLSATQNTCPFCSAHALIINDTTNYTGSSNNFSMSTCPPAVLCNMTATLNAAGDLAIQVMTANLTLLNRSLTESMLSSNTTLLSLNDSLQFAIMSANGVITVFVMANACSICNATSFVINVTETTANISNGFCPPSVGCNVTVSRNATGSIVIQVFTANMTLLNSSFSDSALDGNETVVQGNNSTVHIAFNRTIGMIEVFAVKNNCSYCSTSFFLNNNDLQCPQEVVCNVAAFENTNGTVSIQVSASNIVLFSILVLPSVLNDTEMMMYNRNNNLTLTFQGINRSIKVFVDNDSCVLCESETTIIAIEEPTTNSHCICTSQQKCVNGMCQSIETSIINANTVKLVFSAPVSMIGTAARNGVKRAIAQSATVFCASVSCGTKNPALYTETDIVLVDTTRKRQASSQLLIYIHHPAGSVSLNPDNPLVPAATSMSIVQASIATIQNITGLSVLTVSLYQSPAVENNEGVLIAAIVGPVLGGAALIILLFLAVLIIVIVSKKRPKKIKVRPSQSSTNLKSSEKSPVSSSSSTVELVKS